ncbi:uncharacterized protein LAESUDRAFT_721312 [Laetiporus sulphureus 93-53]|uniref:NAD(+) diphosphatase n=1 Tax=Laetiporus sulphureus 93-53 TaxID=1314785 RepID=A0A165GWB4_9APHY|nr:uncharacterized protein LAESUDRAFT_721312 [Laetiporus sulphureus 93-53]KZT10913.1 hypothetical protein LAESUDRAFT_721312 [Laetiporus sulphureus 93-53]
MVRSVVNFFGGSPLNRLSWLRTYQPFLNSIVGSPATRWLVFRRGEPLMVTSRNTQKPSLAQLSTADVKPLLGAEPFFGQGQNTGEHGPGDLLPVEGARFHGPPLVFLGLLEKTHAGGTHALPSSAFSAKQDADTVLANLEGTPYFSLDASNVEQDKLDSTLHGSQAGKEGAEFAFVEARGAMAGFDEFEASIFAMARTMVDWNARNKFCPSCGSASYSQWAGWKLSCSSLLPWADTAGKKPCLTAKGLHNFSHPRTDSVIITAIVDQANEKILLGKNKNWPARFYSTLAGFIEPGESLEDAVKREMWEEAGVDVWDVQYHSSQPWPYPASLMVGFYAVADSTKALHTDLDNELEDVHWYTREEVLSILKHEEGAYLSSREYRKMAEAQDERDHLPHQSASGAANKQENPGAADDQLVVPFRIPPMTAVGGILIRDWALGLAGPGIKEG